jgi:hypothetical protein
VMLLWLLSFFPFLLCVRFSVRGGRRAVPFLYKIEKKASAAENISSTGAGAGIAGTAAKATDAAAAAAVPAAADI